MQVVKSDSKGRVSIGYKNAQFKVHKLGRTILLEFMDSPMELLTYPAPQPALDYLISFGLNPMQVSGDGADEFGYQCFELDDEGKPIREYGRRKQTRKPWPEGFDWAKFVQLAVGLDA